MPISVNVGLSRKASRDYQSAGVSINVTAELDQALLAKPDELQKQVSDLYAQAQQALESQANNMAEPDHRPHQHDAHQPNGNGHHDRNNGRNSGNDRDSAFMTDSQRRAIHAIAKRLDRDVDYECREIIGTEFDAMTIRQASELIDHLKGQQSAGNGHRSNGR